MTPSQNALTRDVLAKLEAAGLLPADTGIAVCVVSSRELLWQGTFGLRDRERGLPVTPRTVFEAGSITKSLTAAALLQEHAAVRIDLEAPVAGHLPELRLQDEAVTAQLTPQDMLVHRSGLPAWDLRWLMAPADERPADMLAAFRHLGMVPGGFRREFIYNNLMYAALGQLLEALTGEPWETVVRRRLLEPLGITGASFSPADGEDDVALGYAGQRMLPRRSLAAIAPAGALRVHITDLATWLQLQLRRGRGREDAGLLPAPAGARMHTSGIAIRERNPALFQGFEWLDETAGYAPGWFTGEVDRQPLVWHPAWIDGFSAGMLAMPTAGWAAAVLCNQNMSPLPGLLIRALLADQLGRDLPEAPRAAAPPPATERPAADPPAGWTGRFAAPGWPDIELADDGGPVIRMGEHRWPLRFTAAAADEAGPAGLVTIPAFGLELPFPARFVATNQTVTAVELPLSGDPRVPPVRFARDGDA